MEITDGHDAVSLYFYLCTENSHDVFFARGDDVRCLNRASSSHNYERTHFSHYERRARSSSMFINEFSSS